MVPYVLKMPFLREDKSVGLKVLIVLPELSFAFARPVIQKSANFKCTVNLVLKVSILE